MKLIQTFHKLTNQALKNLPNNDVFLKSLPTLTGLLLVALAIWLIGPYVAWDGYAPLAATDKRVYITLFLFLGWLLKFLTIDMDTPNPFQYKDNYTRKKLTELLKRFHGAKKFLRKTTNTKQGKLRLNNLPWYLLIGPSHAGKTSLLANSDVQFILQRRFQADLHDLESSENCDWWVTRDATIIDVPGKYISHHAGKAQTDKPNVYPLLWQFFLRLIKKHQGKNGIAGIIVAIPFAEVMKEFNAKKSETKHYQTAIRDLFQRLHDLQEIFPQPIPCQIVLTKCDLLAGFNEFFAEASNEEISQAWGLTIPTPKENEKAYDLFANRFNALIKKLNQQLLWRLHQERNPMARPYIKDFPLQVERVKELTLDFIKRLTTTHSNLTLQGVYLTSALQPKPEKKNTVIDQATNNSQRSVQIFKAPAPNSRPYFIKQYLTQGIGSLQIVATPATVSSTWKRRTAYAASAGAVVMTAAILGNDFHQGVQQAYSIQNNLADYQLRIAQVQDPDEHLAKTLLFLNSLHQSVRHSGFSVDLAHFLSFYTHKSQEKANEVYQQALRTILLPEIKNYFEAYLQYPVNKNMDYVYATLKAYLMLGNASYFDPNFIALTFKEALPKSFNREQASQLMEHATLALNTAWNPMALDQSVVRETRKYLAALPSYQLAYVILKNINGNNVENEINLGINEGKNPIFVSQQMLGQVPHMFTAKAFTTVLSQEITTAAQEAAIGNWVLGDDFRATHNPTLANSLIDQLRVAYVNNYVDVWERMLANIHLSKASNLAQLDMMIINLSSQDSPLIQLLQTLKENTYFDPIASTSPKLLGLSLLVEKNNQSQQQLYQIFTSLQLLHQYVQKVLSSDNENKAAFEVISNFMQNRGTPDAITQVRLIAEKCPDPVKNWLNKVADDTWSFLMQDAGHYLDTSWQNQVYHPYKTEIANRYPFSAATSQEVSLQQFTQFFGNPGIIVSYYNTYLQGFVDTSSQDWRWKKIDNHRLPFSDETLRQIQQAMRIYHTFFPNNDNKLFVQFALQPYKFGPNVKSIKLSINDKNFFDIRHGAKTPHIVTWPSNSDLKTTSIQMTMANEQIISRDFPGDWGWFKLVSESFEGMVSKKAVLINLSVNQHPAKYILFTDSQMNPFLSLSLNHFRLPEALTEKA